MSYGGKKDNVMDDVRVYWRDPRLASRLSQEKRVQVTERFLEFVEKSKEENAKRMSKIMKERNKLMLYVEKEMREK